MFWADGHIRQLEVRQAGYSSNRNRCNAMCTLRRLFASLAFWTAMADGPQTTVTTTTRDPNSKPACGCSTTSVILFRAAPCHIFPVSCHSMSSQSSCLEFHGVPWSSKIFETCQSSKESADSPVVRQNSTTFEGTIFESRRSQPVFTHCEFERVLIKFERVLINASDASPKTIPKTYQLHRVLFSSPRMSWDRLIGQHFGIGVSRSL